MTKLYTIIIIASKAKMFSIWKKTYNSKENNIIVVDNTYTGYYYVLFITKFLSIRIMVHETKMFFHVRDHYNSKVKLCIHGFKQ